MTKTSATLIDNIFIDSNLLGRHSSWIKVDDISDHLPSLLILDQLIPKTQESVKISCRDMRDCTLKKIESELSGITSDNVITENVNTSFNAFHDIVCTTINKHSPLKSRTIKAKKLWKEPWITSGLQKCIRKQKLLYQNSISCDASSNAIKKYKDYRNTLGKVKREAQ